MSVFGLQDYGVKTIGNVPTGLPSLSLPDVSLIVQLWPAALGIVLMSFTETIAAGRAFIGSGEPPPQGNRELLAKSLTFFAGADAAGIVLGARVPIILTSRADSLIARLASCAVAALVAAARRTNSAKAVG